MTKILIVDDEPPIVKMITYLLKDTYGVITAASGEEALKKIHEDSVDLVLSDVNMPGMSGFDLTKKIREDESTRWLPVVIVTGLQSTEDRIQGIEAGCDDFISKPFDKDEILAKVKTILKLSYYRRQLDEKEKFEAVIHGMSDGIVVCDRDWKIRQINASAEKYMNISAPQEKGLLDIIFKNYSVSLTREELINLAQPHKAFDVVREETPTVKPFILKANVDIFMNPSGETSHIVMILRDVTEERQKEAMKNSFLSLMSHKLNTPIVIVSEGLEMMCEGILGPLTDDQKEVAQSALDGVRLLKESVLKLLGFTELNSQKTDLTKENIELSGYLSKLRDSVMKRVKDKKMIFNIDGPKDARINIKSRHLDLIFENLIENALKFNDKNTIEIKIVVKDMPDGLEISMSDNGCGIPAEEYDRVFEKFYQIDKHATGQVKGMGLGLAIVRHLVTVYTGRISIASEIGQGSTFTFSFPRLYPDNLIELTHRES